MNGGGILYIRKPKKLNAFGWFETASNGAAVRPNS